MWCHVRGHDSFSDMPTGRTENSFSGKTPNIFQFVSTDKTWFQLIPIAPGEFSSVLETKRPFSASLFVSCWRDETDLPRRRTESNDLEVQFILASSQSYFLFPGILERKFGRWMALYDVYGNPVSYLWSSEGTNRFWSTLQEEWSYPFLSFNTFFLDSWKESEGPLLAGAAAGFSASVTSYPFDLVRTRLAAQKEPKVHIYFLFQIFLTLFHPWHSPILFVHRPWLVLLKYSAWHINQTEC